MPGHYLNSETGFHYNYHRYYDPRTGRYLSPDPIGLEGGINLFAYAGNNPVNGVDPEGLTWAETLGMFWNWLSGTGPNTRIFGSGSNQVIDLMNAPGVNKAREAFYAKNAGNSFCEKPRKFEPLLNFNPGFGLRGLWTAGFDPTEQFVGNYRVDIIPNNNGKSIRFVLTNTTSMTSFLYGIAPSWNRSSFGPGGNMIQTYTWTEEIQR